MITLLITRTCNNAVKNGKVSKKELHESTNSIPLNHMIMAVKASQEYFCVWCILLKYKIEVILELFTKTITYIFWYTYHFYRLDKVQKFLTS